MMIKKAAVSPSGVSSETKKIRKASPGLSTLTPVVRPPHEKTAETPESAPRVIRSLGGVQAVKGGEAKSGKKASVMIQKAGQHSTKGPLSSGSSPGGAKASSSDSPGRGPSEQARGTTSKPGASASREGGGPQKGGRDLRSFVGGTNPERSLISAQNLPFLRRFVTEQGKILSRRLTRVTARQQREITKAIKQARILGYLQFVNTK
jgi:small subunit ribosomal protein S18